MKITLQTLTPLWTGGVDGTTDRLHETAIIGSLRWWYEALVRGLGGYACDPTGEGRCEYNPKDPRPPEKQLCPACYLFGATGWGRRFRLQISDSTQELLQGHNLLIPSGRVHKSKKGTRSGGWFVVGESRIGEIVLEILPLQDIDLGPFSTIMTLISRHATFGAKISNGYGVVQIKDMPSATTWTPHFENPRPPRNNVLPDFRDFFFAKFQFQEPEADPNWWKQIEGIRQAANGKLDDGSSYKPLKRVARELEQIKQEGILPIAPAVRNWLHYKWPRNLSAAEKHFVFGEARAVCPHCYQPGFKPNKTNPDNLYWCFHCKSSFNKGEEIPATASKLFISYAYHLGNRQWEFRIWGWLPSAGRLVKRDEFLQALKNTLSADALWKFVFGRSNVKPVLVEWHALSKEQTDGWAYLQELMGGAS